MLFHHSHRVETFRLNFSSFPAWWNVSKNFKSFFAFQWLRLEGELLTVSRRKEWVLIVHLVGSTNDLDELEMSK